MQRLFDSSDSWDQSFESSFFAPKKRGKKSKEELERKSKTRKENWLKLPEEERQRRIAQINAIRPKTYSFRSIHTLRLRQEHAKKYLTNPLIMANRNMDFHNDPAIRKLRSLASIKLWEKERVKEKELTPRVNTYCGVITQEDFDKLNG
jgi:hypothetical protein